MCHEELLPQTAPSWVPPPGVAWEELTCPVCGPAHAQNSPGSWQEQRNPHTIICGAVRTYPASQPSLLGTGKLLPAHLLILAALPGTAFTFQDRAATMGCVHLSGAVFKTLRPRTFPLEIPAPPACDVPEHQPWATEPAQALELNL